MITYPGLPGPVVSDHLSRAESRRHYDPGTEFNIGRIEMVGNTGTYIDAPFHRFEEGTDLAELPLQSVAGLPGVCIAVEEHAISPAALEGVEIAGHAVLFATGWDRHWRTEAYGADDHPHLTAETVEHLVAGAAAVVGIDSVNIDATTTGSRPAHTGLLQAGVPIVEHLTGLGDLVGTRFRFFAVPVKVRRFSSFPVRAFAEVE